MGKEKSTQTTVQNTTYTPTPTAEETEFNKLQLQNIKDLNPQSQALQSAGLDLGKLLLQGMQLPGYLKDLPGGISSGVVDDITQQSLKDVNNQLAFSGAGTFLESGAAQSVGARTAADVRNNAAQFNLQNLAQLINLAVGGQAAPLQFGSAQGAQLGQRLAGLRSVNQTGTNSLTTTSMNPFLKSFQTSLGTSLGSGSFGNFKAF